MKKLKLIGYDNRVKLQGNLGFLKIVVKNSLQGFLISIGFIACLVLIDFIARYIYESFGESDYFILNVFADFFNNINKVIGVKFIDYFKDVIVIVAGILGVILGLFFTTFLNIISAKYSNISSVVISQLQEQKTINRYFKLLSVLVASSIIFQFLLVVGYAPTIISAFIFSGAVVMSMLAFIAFGRFTIIYFNADALVYDIINECKGLLFRAHKNSKLFNTTNSKFRVTHRIYWNIDKVKVIVEESLKPNLSNTALDRISNELLEFGIHYNASKHIIPSGGEWHITIQKYKKWEEASSFEFEHINKSGSFLLPKSVDDYISIEKAIMNTQFFIFNQETSVVNRLQLIQDQYKYLQVISFQCEIDLFKQFFLQLKDFVLKEIEEEEGLDNRVKYVSLYSSLMIQYLVGFNHNLPRVVKLKNIKKLAENTCNFKSIDKVMNMPYSMRILIDDIQKKIRNEKYTEGKIVTPLFYVEYLFSNRFQYVIKMHFEAVSEFIFEQILKFSSELQKKKMLVEAFELCNESLELYQKIEFFSHTVKSKVIELNQINLKKEEKYHFNEREAIMEKNELFRKKLIKNIWDLGGTSYKVSSDELPDMFGSFYHFISNNILEIALVEDPIDLKKYLPKFCLFNLLYLQKLQKNIDNKNFEYSTSKLYPILVDLFEICSISILVFRGFHLKDAEQEFFDFWNNAFDGDEAKEKSFWSFMIVIYEYFNQPLKGFATNSYMKEQDRKKKFEEFIKESSLVRIEEMKDHPFAMEHYVTDIDDPYLQAIVKRLSIDGIGGFTLNELSEVFIEFFLRTRMSLKEVKIKETRYGESVRRYMERD